ncbi:MAG: YdbL family protein [Desulfatitalea sp.]|nr:YdbL family protein [Desulfatitalea sp.]
MKANGKTGLGIIVLVLIAASAIAAGGQDIKERMRERLPVIVDLKARGVAGENNQGYLELLKGQTEKADVVAAENQDRRAIYAHIAKQTGTTVEKVAQRRAIQIAEKASPGEWLQDAAGNWHQK